MNDDPHGEPGDDQFDELREAAGAVVDSLKRLIEATERVIEQPGAFAGAVESGRSVVEAFLGGFASQADPDGATAEGDQGPTES
ncbi:MAG: hypothetical protein R8F63_07990 [Acidimicrobiales bacterium]|nr:hypothetical protein [Acidimicrobiales bacterium]